MLGGSLELEKGNPGWVPSGRAVVAASVRRATTVSLRTTHGRRTNGFQSDVTTVKGEIEKEDEEENVEDLVRKSNRFLLMNLSNPKEDFFET